VYRNAWLLQGSSGVVTAMQALSTAQVVVGGTTGAGAVFPKSNRAQAEARHETPARTRAVGHARIGPWALTRSRTAAAGADPAFAGPLFVGSFSVASDYVGGFDVVPPLRSAAAAGDQTYLYHIAEVPGRAEGDVIILGTYAGASFAFDLKDATTVMRTCMRARQGHLCSVRRLTHSRSAGLWLLCVCVCVCVCACVCWWGT
jgi:hypothetical protein